MYNHGMRPIQNLDAFADIPFALMQGREIRKERAYAALAGLVLLVCAALLVCQWVF